MRYDYEVPRRSYEDLRKAADWFLREHHPGGEIPIPVEEILELKLRKNIVPEPGLQEAFEVDAFTSSDMEDIIVADFAQKRTIHIWKCSKEESRA